MMLISGTSTTYINAMMAAPVSAESKSPWRADRRAAPARRECDGARANCATDRHASQPSREK
jgi:hypothetical protein